MMQHKKADAPASTRLNNKQWHSLQKILHSPNFGAEKKRQLLRAKNFSINSQCAENGNSLLFEACIEAGASNNLSLIRFLLENGANPNQGDDCGMRPLSLAAQMGSLALVQLLIEAGAEINFIPHDIEAGYSPLCAAVAINTNEGAKIAAYLLEKGADPNLAHPELLQFPLFNAAVNKNVALARLLLKHGANPHAANKQGISILHVAAEHSSLGLILPLLQAYKVDPNCRSASGETPLHFFVKFIKEDDKHFEALCRSIFTCFKDAGADFSLVCNSNVSLLRRSIKNNKLRVAEFLLQHGADVNEPWRMYDEEKQATYICTLLHYATYKENYPLIKFLLEHGANINAIEQYDYEIKKHIPNKVPCELEQLTLICVANRKDADLNLGEHTTFITPLHIACSNGNLRLVKMFCETYQADINAKAKNGTTPLFLAAQEGHLDIVKFLLETYPETLEVEAERTTGHFALSIANKYDHREVVEFIFTHYYVKRFKLEESKEINYESMLHHILNRGEHRLASLEKIYALTTSDKTPSKDDDNTIPKLPHEASPQSMSGYQYLLSQGLFSSKEISSLKEERCKDEPEKEKRETIKNVEISWLEGLITSSMPEIQAIDDSTSHKTPNCFFYLDTQGLLKQGCDIETFKNIVLRFSAAKNENGLKSLKGETKCIDITFGQEKIQAKLLWSLKKKSIKERVLCFSLSSDDGKHTLIIGAFYYAKGLKSYDVSLWRTPSNKAHKVYLPPSAKARKKAKQQEKANLSKAHS